MLECGARVRVQRLEVVIDGCHTTNSRQRKVPPSLDHWNQRFRVARHLFQRFDYDCVDQHVAILLAHRSFITFTVKFRLFLFRVVS